MPSKIAFVVRSNSHLSHLPIDDLHFITYLLSLSKEVQFRVKSISVLQIILCYIFPIILQQLHKGPPRFLNPLILSLPCYKPLTPPFPTLVDRIFGSIPCHAPPRSSQLVAHCRSFHMTTRRVILSASRKLSIVYKK